MTHAVEPGEINIGVLGVIEEAGRQVHLVLDDLLEDGAGLGQEEERNRQPAGSRRFEILEQGGVIADGTVQADQRRDAVVLQRRIDVGDASPAEAHRGDPRNVGLGDLL